MSNRSRFETNYATYSSYNGDAAPNQAIAISERFASPPPPPIGSQPAQSARAPPTSSQPIQPASTSPPKNTRVHHANCDAVYNLLLDESRQRVPATGQPVRVMIKISTEWCGPCKKIAPFLHELSVHPDCNDILFIEVDGDELMQHPKLANILQVSAVPSFFGFVAGKKVGFMTGIDQKEIVEFCEKIKRS